MNLQLKLSQCMIVKNEENNIERALSWGKEFLYEQIVVDTGSTDRTVEIAENMGAKVYHFNWIDDFAIAKNYAISKATGEWIAFLDADEYVPEKDIDKLIELMNDIQEKEGQGEVVDGIRLRIYNLDDNNNIRTGNFNDRFFRNADNIRYEGRIHECVGRTDGEKFVVRQDEDIKILHTGYQTKEVEEKNKKDRNFELLKKEYEQDPNNVSTCYYLSNEYLRLGNREKAVQMLKKVIMKWDLSDSKLFYAIAELIQIYTESSRPKKYEQDVIKLYKRYLTLPSPNPDVELAVGGYFHKIGRRDEAIQFYEGSLEILKGLEDNTCIRYSYTFLAETYFNLAQLYEYKKKNDRVVQYLTLSLKIKPYQVLCTKVLLNLFKNNNENVQGVLVFLERIYRLDDFKNRCYLYSIAKEIGYVELQQDIGNVMSEEERELADNFQV